MYVDIGKANCEAIYTVYMQTHQVRTWHVPLQTNWKLDSESITQSELTTPPLLDLEAAH